MPTRDHIGQDVVEAAVQSLTDSVFVKAPVSRL